MNQLEHRRRLVPRLAVTFLQYFVVVAYVLFVLRRFGTLLTALPLAEGLILLLLGAAGCFLIVRCLDAWLAAPGRTGQTSI
jgi:hypothetical protein